jgi:hypothetical protein
MEIKIKMQIEENRMKNLSRIRNSLSEFKAKLEKMASKFKNSRYIYKLFNEPYLPKIGKDYFKGISHFYNLFEEELNTNSIFNETFHSRIDKHNVDFINLGNHYQSY